MAGFQAITNGRFWVITEAEPGVSTQLLRHFTHTAAYSCVDFNDFTWWQLARQMLSGTMESEVMNAATKIGIALMVLAVFVFQPFTKCFATPAKAMSHHCCPPPAKAECKVASCVCETTDSTSAPVPASSDSAHGVPMLATAEAETPAFVVPRIAVYERSRLAVNDRFIVLHQFLI